MKLQSAQNTTSKIYGYQAPINSTKKLPYQIKQVTSVNILGSVTSKPQFDFKKNPLHRALFQRYNQSCRSKFVQANGISNSSEVVKKYSSFASSESKLKEPVSPLRADKSLDAKIKPSKDLILQYHTNKNDPLLLNHPKSSKFTDGFTAMYSDNGLTAASRIKKKQEQRVKQQLFLEFNSTNQKQKTVSQIYSTRSQVSQSRFERLHKERNELILKMNNSAIKIQCLFREFYSRKIRLEMEKERQLKERQFLRHKIQQMRSKVSECLLGVDSTMTKAALKLQKFYRGRIARKNFKSSQRAQILKTHLDNLFLYHKGKAFYDLLDIYIEEISNSNKNRNFFMTEQLPSPSQKHFSKPEELYFTPNFSTQEGEGQILNEQQNQQTQFQIVKGFRMQSMITEEQQGEGQQENRVKNQQVILMQQQSPHQSIAASSNLSSNHLVSRKLQRNNDHTFKPISEYYEAEQAIQDELHENNKFVNNQSIFDSFPSPSKMPSMIQDLSPIKPLSSYDQRIDNVAASMAKIFRRDSATSSAYNQIQSLKRAGSVLVNSSSGLAQFQGLRSHKKKQQESSRASELQQDEQISSIALKKQNSSPEKLTSYSKVEKKKILPRKEEALKDFDTPFNNSQQHSERKYQLFKEGMDIQQEDNAPKVEAIDLAEIDLKQQEELSIRLDTETERIQDSQGKKSPRYISHPSQIQQNSKFKYFNRLVSFNKKKANNQIPLQQKISNNRLSSKTNKQSLNNKSAVYAFKPTQPVSNQRLNRLSRPLTAKSSSSAYNISNQTKKLNKRGSSFARLKRIQSARRDIFKNPNQKGRKCDQCQTQQRNRKFTTNASCTTLSEHYRKSAARLQIATNQQFNFLSTDNSSALLQNVKSTKSMGTTTSASTVTARLYSAKNSHSQRRICSASSSSQSTSFLISSQTNNNYSRAALLLSGRTSSGDQIAEDLIGSGRIEGDPELEKKIRSLNQKALGEPIKKYQGIVNLESVSPIKSLEPTQKMTRYQKHQFFSLNTSKVKIENPFALEMSQCGGIASLLRKGIRHPVRSQQEPTMSPDILSEKSGGVIKSATNQDTEKQVYSQPHQKLSSKFQDVFPELTNIMKLYGPSQPSNNKKPQQKTTQLKKFKKGWIVM